MSYVLDERQLGGLVNSVIAGVPILGSILEGDTNPTPSDTPSATTPSTPPLPTSPSTPPPSTSPSTPPPSTSPSTPPPSTSPSTPPPSTSPSIPPPSTPSPPSSPPPSPSTSPPSTPPPSTRPPSTRPPSNRPPSTPSFSPPSSPPPSDPSPASVQSPTPSNSIGGSPSPSPSGDSSPSNGASLPSSSDSGGSSSGGGVPSSPSSTTPSSPPSSPSTQDGSSQGTSPGTVTNGLTANSISSSITSTPGGSLDSPSSPFSSTVAITNVGTTSPLRHTTSTRSGPNAIISGSPSLINDPSSTNPANGAGPNSVSSALADPHHHLSPAQIAAIIIVVLIFLITLPIIVFFLRRRSKIHRADRSTKWWFATARTSQLYGDGVTEHLIPPGTQTARSSFGTTIDHSESGHPTYVIPPFPPPTVEMGRDNASRPALVINIEGNSNNNSEENRYSTGSAGSDHSQYLIIPQRNSTNPDQQVATPMSVRPFSPSESFAFPKPPEPVAAAGSGSVSVAGGSSRPTSNATSITLTTPPLPPGLASIPSLVPLVVGPSTSKSPSSTTNPFKDSTTPTIDNSPYSDIPVEVVRRPFEPTLPDELVVNLDDRVRVLHRFDDGWGLIEKVRRDGGEGERGLIPMDCLRKAEVEEELGTGRRSSSYEGPCAI